MKAKKSSVSFFLERNFLIFEIIPVISCFNNWSSESLIVFNINADYAETIKENATKLPGSDDQIENITNNNLYKGNYLD